MIINQTQKRERNPKEQRKAGFQHFLKSKCDEIPNPNIHNSAQKSSLNLNLFLSLL